MFSCELGIAAKLVCQLRIGSIIAAIGKVEWPQRSYKNKVRVGDLTGKYGVVTFHQAKIGTLLGQKRTGVLWYLIKATT
jgi:hypothetical protein